MRLRKATASEQEAYKGIYPLYGFVKIEGHECPVEFLGSVAGEDDPRYEIMMPDGFHVAQEWIHTRLCWTLAEVREEARSITLEPCTSKCQ